MFTVPGPEIAIMSRFVITCLPSLLSYLMSFAPLSIVSMIHEAKLKNSLGMD